MNYREYVRPKYVDLMKALGMECVFHRASGAELFYYDNKGNEVAVTDFLGGYGAALFGHNDPHLSEELMAMLDRKVPFHAQLSVREGAGELGFQLSEAITKELNIHEKYITTFSNSGAEAVEVALKHAEFSRQKKLHDIFNELDYQLSDLLKKFPYRTVDTEILGLPTELLPASMPEVNMTQLVEALRQHNLRQLYLAPVFVALKNCFHGKLVTTVQLTHGKQYSKSFSRFGLNVEYVDSLAFDEQLNTLEDRYTSHWLSLKIHGDQVHIEKIKMARFGGLLLEPIQGEGGINEFDAPLYMSLKRFCNKQQCPLIIDEVQSGFGRTGKLLASSHYSLTGDYYCLSKAIGGGLTKIAATLIRHSHYEDDFSYLHSSTFAEDEMSCRIALSSLRRLLENDGRMLDDITEKGNYIINKLKQLMERHPKIIKEIRGRGLLVGIELFDLRKCTSMVISSTQYNEALGYMLAGYLLKQESIRVAPSASNSNVIRLEPPACISIEQIDKLVAALDRMCDLLHRQDAFPLAASVCSDMIQAISRREERFGQTLESEIQQQISTTQNQQKIVSKVAFINHLIDSDMMSEVDASLSGLNSAQKKEFVKRMKPERRAIPIGPVVIRSKLGMAVEFTLYPLCMDSDAMAAYLSSDELHIIREEISDRIRDAREDGCVIAGLGMYTSIVTNNCQSIHVNDIALTSGNALTIGMGLKAIEQGCQHQALELSKETAVVIGAAGNIASTYASLLSEKVNNIILLGSGRDGSLKRLEKTAYLIYEDAAESLRNGDVSQDLLAQKIDRIPEIRSLIKNHDGRTSVGKKIYDHVDRLLGIEAFIRVSDKLELVKEAKIVLCAANAPQAFLGAEHFAERSVICDIAVPLNVSPEVANLRSDILYMHGGIVRTPAGDGLLSNVRAYLKEDQLYACMAESVLMGLAGMSDHYSFGDISRDQVRCITNLADMHGFSLAELKTSNSF